MRHAARRFAWALLLTLLLLALAVAWLVSTESGLRWGLAQARPFLPGGVEIASAEGRLIGPLVLEGLAVETDAATVRLERLALDWSPGALLAGLLRIEYLHVDDVGIDLHPGEGGGERAAPVPPTTLHLPVAVQVREARLHTLRIRSEGIEPVIVDRAEAGAVVLKAGVTIDRLRAEGPRFRLAGSMVLGGVAPFPLDASLQWRLQPGELVAPLAGTLELGGSLLRLEGDLRLNEPQPVRIRGSLQPFEQPLPWRLEVTGDGLSPRQWHTSAPDRPFDIDLRADGRDDAAMVEGRVGGEIEPLGMVRADVRVRLTPAGADLHRLRLSRRQGAGEVTAEGRIDWGGDAPVFDLALEWQRLQWPLDAAEPQLASVEGTARITGTPADYAVALDAALQPRGLPAGRWQGDLEGSPDGLRHIDLRGDWAGARLRAGGALDWKGGAPRFDLALEWQNLQWPLNAAAPRARSAEGTARVTGTPADYAVAFEAGLEPQGLPPGRWRGDIEGTLEGLQRIDLHGDWLGGRIRADGSVAWDEVLDGRARLEADGIEPGRIDSRLSGHLSLAAEGHYRQLESGRASGRFTLQRLAGTLNNIHVEGEGLAWFDGDEWRLPRLRVTAGESRATLRGVIADTLDLSVELVVANLGAWLPETAGSVTADARVKGTLRAPSIDLEARADTLRYQDLELDEARLTAAVEALGRAPSTLTLELGELATREQPGRDERVIRLRHLALEITGTRAAHTARLAVDAPPGALVLHARGGERDDGWMGRLRELTVSPAGHPAWQLETGQQLRIDAEGLDAGRQCLARGEARLCIAGAVTAAGDWRAQWQVKGVEADELLRLWRDDVRAEGRLSSEGALRGREGVDRGTVRVSLEAGLLERRLDEEWIELLRWQRSTAAIDVRPERFGVRLEAPLAASGHVDVEVSLPRTAGGDLSGNLAADVRQLEWLPLLVPGIGSIEGRAQLDLSLAGSESAPELRGRMALIDGTVSIPRLGVVWRDLRIGLDTDNRVIRLQARGRSGDGPMRADAILSRKAGSWQARGSLSGLRFTAMDTAEARILVTPDLEWRYEDRQVTVEGRLEIPVARLEPRDLAGAVSVSADARIVGVEARERKPPLRIRADVAVELGEDVRFDGFGLRGRLEGGLHIRQQPGELAMATGEVRVVEGEYEVYRQKLTIERGLLLFDGPVDNPGLDIRAVRRPREVLVGVNVRGTLQEPRLMLFSEPPMQESQILSYLVLGIPLNETGDEDRGQLAAAAAAATLAGGEWAQQLGAGLGITDVRVDSGAAGEASLVLGKYLTPRLYASYGIGLFEDVNTLRLRYQLTRNWSLEGKSGTVSSGDVLYTIER